MKVSIMKVYIGNISQRNVTFYYGVSIEHGYQQIDIPSMSVKELDTDWNKDSVDTLIKQHTPYGFTDVTKRGKEKIDVTGDLVYSIDRPLYEIELVTLGE